MVKPSSSRLAPPLLRDSFFGTIDLGDDGVPAAVRPMLPPTKFELIINLNTAKALGLSIPGISLAIVHEVTD
jgi:hypothetical protein